MPAAIQPAIVGPWTDRPVCDPLTKEASMPKMRAVHVKHANGPFELVERDAPEPGTGPCADQGPGLRRLPQRCLHQDRRVSGHRVSRGCRATRSSASIETVGQRVPDWKAASASASAGMAAIAAICQSCRRGDFITCVNAQVPGISYDGGYADYMIAPFEALAAIPEELEAAEAAPLLCAGITTFNALRNSGARAGDTRRHPRHRRARPSRRAVRRQDGLPYRRHRPRRRQGAARAPARRPPLHRQHDAGRRRRADEARRRQGDPRHRDQAPRR